MEVNVPGVMAMLAAPVVAQPSMLLEPELMLVGLAVKELMVGFSATVTVTVAVAVVDPAALVAVSVYIVVTVGSTLVDPLADVEVNVPGVMAMLAAPVVAQLSMLLEPELMLTGLAVKELMVGFAGIVTVTAAVAVVDPAALVAVSVYIVVTVGSTLVEPLADVEVNPPGEIEIVVALLVSQLSILFAPAFMLAGSAVKEVIEGREPVPGRGLGEPTMPAQFVRPTQASSTRMRTTAPRPE